MRFFIAALLLSAATSWTTPSVSKTRPLPSSSTSTVLFNVPPPAQEDTVAFKEYASKLPPPASFFELQKDCLRSAKMAIKNGHLLIEVEFPPLPAKVLDMDDVSAYDVANANLKLAVEFAKGFVADNKKVAILLPDESEAKIAIEQLTGNEDARPTTQVEAGITVSSLRRSEEGDDRIIKVCTCPARNVMLSAV
jgi:hypothetical protein